MNIQDINRLDFDKSGGLIPAIVQDNRTGKVLMLGFMNSEALRETLDTGKVTFYSRTRKRLWTKGEESGHFLDMVSIAADCDNDALLVKVTPRGAVCHTGSDTCWNEDNSNSGILFLEHLQNIVEKRRQEMPEGSYTTRLFKEGTAKIAQKVGEEAVETIIGALTNDNNNFIYEGADLLYHLIVLLTQKGYRLDDLAAELEKRHK